MNSEMNKPSGILASFDNPAQLLEAAHKVREAGYTKYDCHSPFPIHGMDSAMGLKRSPLGYIVFVVAAFALLGGFALEWWTSSVEYPLVISGKPFFSYQAYGPVAFAIMVLSSAFVSLLGMLVLNKLPMFYHPLFSSKSFENVMDDGFFVSIESADEKFEMEETKRFLSGLGANKLEVISEE